MRARHHKARSSPMVRAHPVERVGCLQSSRTFQESGTTSQGQIGCPSWPPVRHSLGSGRSAHLTCTTTQTRVRPVSKHVQARGPSLGTRTVDQDGLERSVDRSWKLSLVERLQICFVCILAQISGDPDLVNFCRLWRISSYIIQRSQARDCDSMSAGSAGIRVNECAIGLISHGRSGRSRGGEDGYIQTEGVDY